MSADDGGHYLLDVYRMHSRPGPLRPVRECRDPGCPLSHVMRALCRCGGEFGSGPTDWSARRAHTAHQRRAFALDGDSVRPGRDRWWGLRWIWSWRR